MYHIAFKILVTLVILSGITFSFSPSTTAAIPSQNQNTSIGEFEKMAQVLTHPRCMNCHPSDNYLRQGDDSHKHLFDVQRGADGHGLPAMQCKTCHQSENNKYSGVPGAPHWHLAPLSMGWQGLTISEIGHSIKDPNKNGGRDLKALVEHLTSDPLVLWAWNPGVNAQGMEREKPPLSKEEWVAAVEKWAETGAHVPE